MRKLRTNIDPNRANTLPRFLPDDERMPQANGRPVGVTDATLQEKQRDLIKDIINKGENNASTKPNREEMLAQIQRDREQESMNRTQQERDIYTLDYKQIDGTFLLPGKPEPPSVISRADKARSKVKTMKVSVSQEVPSGTVKEFSFLPGALGVNPATRNTLASPVGGKVEQSGLLEDGENGTNAEEDKGKDQDKDEVTRIMSGIHSGSDAINFFARFGSDTPVKFVTLVQVNDDKVFTPYELEVVTLPDYPIEHYTMSPSGIVHVMPGLPSECIPLHSWMRQTMNFSVLRNIPFYKYYLHRKAFTVWKENVHYLLFAKQRKFIANRLFITRKTSCNSILQIKKHLLDIRHVKLLTTDLKFPFSKDAFFTTQTNQCQTALASCEDALRRVITEVKTVLDEVSALHGQANQVEDAYAAGYSDSAAPEKTKSLVKIKQEKEERRLIRLRAKMEYATLSEYIRFVDYLTVETLVTLTVNTITQLYEELTKTRKTGIFETLVKFTTSESGDPLTVFVPGEGDIKDVLDKLLELMINTMGSVNRVNYLHPVNTKSSVAGPNIQAIIRESRQFRLMSDNLKRRVMLDFEVAEVQAREYSKVRPIYDFNQTWDFAAYRQQQHDVPAFKAMMEKFTVWKDILEKQTRNRTTGLLEIDTKGLKSELGPIVDDRMSEIKEYVQDKARERCVALLEQFKDCIAKLAQRPTHLNDYAAYAAVYTTMKEEEKNLFKRTSMIDQMYSLLISKEVKVSSEDSVFHDELHEKQAEYRKQVEEALNYKDSKLAEMQVMVETNIVKLSESISTAVSRLEEPLFTEAENFDNYAQAMAELEAVGLTLERADEKAKAYTSYQKLFGVPPNEYAELETGREAHETMKKLWVTVKEWSTKHSGWMEDDFRSLHVEGIDKEVQVFFKDGYTMHKALNLGVSEILRDKISDFKTIMPTVMDLGNPSMAPRHFQKVFAALEMGWADDSQEFTLSELLKGGVMDFKELVLETSASASGEAQLEDSLSKIQKGWETQKFIVMNHRDQHGLYVLGPLDEIFTLLEDNQVTLQTMLGSRYIGGIQARVEEWEKKLSVLSETLDEWLATQKSWMYLENIFGAEDIQKQLPAESQKFLVVDRSWKTIMTRTNDDSIVINATLTPLDSGVSLLDTFLLNNKILEQIQKSLEDYLETKRMAFPRFYFLSNDELLEILSQTRDPTAVQPHMSKCFDAVKRVRFGQGKQQHEITGFVDPSGEEVKLSANVKAEGPVEYWLLAFEKGMRTALYDSSKSSYVNYPPTPEGSINRADWLWSACAQVIIAIDQTTWTAACAAALYTMHQGEDMEASKNFLEFSLRQIDAMVELVRGQLDKQQRTLIGALLTIDVHARDVTRTIVAKNIASLHDFEWTKQLRYYWDEEIDDIMAKQTNAAFRYGYEYLGNGPRLVITPLTDTCYLTLTGALHMKLGGAPAGPAGTGKTETTKDLAKALAVYCVVFNCSDGLDYKIMGNFFSGLAQQGAWACFDEFNRIDIEVLSVIAQQILCIQQAILHKAEKFDFEGKMIPLNMAFGVFITMNPGYAGRTELPDNLKSLFRPVAMMVPDYRLIAEIMLFAEGFANALPLSNKMAQLYALASEQLSKQSHYDFGMRAVKSVLVAAGQLKRKEPETNEDILLIRAMRDSNVPKFLEQDLPLFGGIVQDLFPGITVPFVDYGKLQQAIEKTLDSLSLQKVPAFITKVIQVHETQLVRHGMMLVGEAGSGKTTNAKVLAKALTQLFEDGVVDRDGFYKTVDRLILNPKSITAGELYGEFSKLTAEWTDGIVPKLVRDCVNAQNEGSDNRKWILFDGPVDAIWIENMNTVLDDNKTLCLANSERIKLPGTLHMVFEVQDLKVASPATVSRCGMVYMEEIHVGIISLVRTWGATVLKSVVGQSAADNLVLMCESHIDATAEFVRLNCREKVATSNGQLTASLLNLISASLQPHTHEMQQICEDFDLINGLFLWCLVWSFGGNLHDDSRENFSSFLKMRFSTVITSRYSPIFVDPYGCFLDLNAKEIKKWGAITPEYHFEKEMPFFNILVPTDETTRARYVLEKMMPYGKNVLFMGETGVGKSVIISAFLNEMVALGKTTSYVMGYSAQTKPANLRDVLETKLEKKRKNLLGPPSGKKFMMFVDDINMPSLETYGAQPPNELLRQVIDQGGFYDVQKLFFKNVADLVCVGACAPPGGGRNEVSPRLMRHFHMIWLTSLSTSSMCAIFTNILHGYMEQVAPAFAPLAAPLVASSVDVYNKIQKELLPTPLRSHYTFNLRDLSKVFQGVLMMKPKFLLTKENLVRLWAHEGNRVFRDRLIDQDDRNWYNNAILKMIHKNLKLDTWGEAEFADVIYADFITTTQKEYQELPDPDKISRVLVEYLDEYNITFPSRMELVFFQDAVKHVSRLSRVLSLPRGNALCVGVGGSGRKSMTRMACFMAGFQCKSIEITRGYGAVEWHDNLKEILLSAGKDNKPTVFLFSDTQIVMELFLEDINNILNSGEVPNLFEPDEIEKIINAVKPLAIKAGRVATRENIFQHYISLVRENLHIVLCMSPIGAGFRTRCRMFPSLVNCCTIDWFNAWPEDALYSVAHRTFEGEKDIGIGDYVDQLSTMCNKMHRAVEIETANYFNEVKRYNYTTPTSYLELIKLYVDILKKQQTKVSNNERRYRVGLNKLKETEDMVAKLEIHLTEMQPVLKQASEDASVLMVEVARDQKDADAQAAIVEVDVQEANKIAASVKVIKDDCQKDLDEAMPAYESAVKALQSLDKKSIQEMKAFPNPPEMVKMTMESVCILFDQKPDWGEAKKLLSKMDFLDQLKAYDKDNIPKKIISKAGKYFNDPAYTPEAVKNQSSAAHSLCLWFRAIVLYDRVAKNIEPKKAALKEAEDQLAATMKELDGKKKTLQGVLDRVAALQLKLKNTQLEKERLEDQALQATKQLGRAGELLGGLASEKSRWQVSATELGESLVNLVGDMSLAAGCLAYLGPFTAQFRQRIVSSWLTTCKELMLPCGNFSLLNSLGDPVVIREWQIAGLPADDFSCENGLLTNMGRRWPLLIDPQGQANRWIRNTYANDNLQVIKLSEKDFLRTLENGIRYGAPVLLENVGQELDPALEPVLLKQIFKRAGQNLIRLGDSDVPYSDEFKFMITTKLANPHYMPEVCIKVTVINFTVTMKGLEDQLLVDVIRNERPDLEEKRTALIVSIAADQSQLLEIEEQILSMLAAASGNILDDTELIDTLKKSKTTSIAINQRLTEAETTNKEISETREGYRVVATRGSVIYFVIANLAMVDPMYQYSLQYFKDLVTLRLQKTEKKSVLEERLELLIADITKNLYLNICRGLFEKDKLLYSFMMSAKINLQAGNITDAEWQTFMVGVVPDPDYLAAHKFNEVVFHDLGITEKNWNNSVLLEKEFEVFKGLSLSIATQAKDWEELFVSDAPQDVVLPDSWDDKLTIFQRLLLMRVLREEMIVFALRVYVGGTIGEFFTESPPFDMEGAYSDSTAVTPLIFILSPGANPTDYLLALAKSKGKEGSSMRIISLGQGQGPIAERAIDMGHGTGDWICLQNCHLAVSWLSKLEQIVEKMQNEPDNINKTFRLWLTSMPSAVFPVVVLQNGIKLTNEPPRGLKANLLRTFLDISPEDYESCSKPAPFKKLLFATGFFNAMILERRKFGAVGWNIPYDWMTSDLKAAIASVRMYIEENDTIPWETLNVIVSDITYGGRVTDIWDKRAISSMLRKYFQPSVLDDDYRFSPDGVFFAPPEGDVEGIRTYVRTLPLSDPPPTFGLHPNAAITFQQKESRALIGTVVTCSGGGGGGASSGPEASTDEKVRDIATKLLARMPKVYDLRKSHHDTFKKLGDSMNSLGVFLSQELIRFNELIEVMISSNKELLRAIKGEVVMSGELELMYNCFVFQNVPKVWEDAGYPCLKPLASWIEDFLARIKFMASWLTEGPRTAYWLSGFFFPQGFMTSVKQTYSRDNKIAVDTLKIGCVMTELDPEGIQKPPPFGAYVYGLFMEGGRFDRSSMTIEDSLPRILFDTLPSIWLKPVVAADYNPVSVYNCPLYKTSLRAGTLSTTGHSTNFVVALPIPTNKEQDDWIRCGCAMLCMLDE